MYICVDPGVEISLRRTDAPWALLMTEDDTLLGRMAEASRSESEKLSKRRWRMQKPTANDSHKQGRWEASNGDTVLAVKLSDYCEHSEGQWEWRSCGHSYCPRCLGHVEPVKRTVLAGPGPIITCNRKPKKSYKTWFCDVFPESGTMAKIARKHLPPVKVTTWEWQEGSGGRVVQARVRDN